MVHDNSPAASMLSTVPRQLCGAWLARATQENRSQSRELLKVNVTSSQRVLVYANTKKNQEDDLFCFTAYRYIDASRASACPNGGGVLLQWVNEIQKIPTAVKMFILRSRARLLCCNTATVDAPSLPCSTKQLLRICRCADASDVLFQQHVLRKT
jgi:hypothetical protein